MGLMQGKPVVPGVAKGEILLSNEPMSFWGGYDSSTGDLIDSHHPLCGQNAVGKVLCIPFTIGSSTTAAVFLQSIRDKTSPVAIITCGVDDFLALASIVGEEMYETTIPIVSVSDENYSRLESGTVVNIDESGQINVVYTK